MSKNIEIPVEANKVYESDSLGTTVVQKNIKQIFDDILSSAESEGLTEDCLKLMINTFVEYAGVDDLENALKKILPRYISELDDDNGVYTGALKLALKVVKAN